jgi:multidrug efflux system membrane fusion protein
VDAAGTLVARNRIVISARGSGRVLELPVTESSRFRAGDLLVRLDAPEIEAAVDRALAAETAAGAALEVAERQAERMTRLAEKQVVTPRDRELAELALRDAEAGLAQAKAVRAAAERELSYAVVRAPRDGVVVRRPVRVGDLASPGMTLLVLEGESAPEVRATLPADLDVPLDPGADVRVRFADGEEFEGTLDRVEPSADLHTRVVYVSVPETGRPTGTFVQVAFPVPRGEPALHVPPGSLVVRGPLRGVFVVREDRAVLRWLRLDADLRDGSRVEVAS